MLSALLSWRVHEDPRVSWVTQAEQRETAALHRLTCLSSPSAPSSHSTEKGVSWRAFLKASWKLNLQRMPREKYHSCWWPQKRSWVFLCPLSSDAGHGRGWAGKCEIWTLFIFLLYPLGWKGKSLLFLSGLDLPWTNFCDLVHKAHLFIHKATEKGNQKYFSL